ncbi:MAG: magnesium chelatase, partial [Ilumatobacter sp.]
LDVMLVASANPEDYTNRGRIITPLKDRFGSQIRTHYPLDAALEYTIMTQEARPLSIGETAAVSVPEYLGEVVANFSQLARASNHVNQRSGVSVRLSVANYEALAANALRRGLKAGERAIVARADDLDALAASSIGKIEIEALEDGREGAIFDSLVKGAVLTVFKDRVDPSYTTPIVDAFEEGLVVQTGEEMISDDLAGLVEQIPALREPVGELTEGDPSPASIAAAVEFILEGLHLSKRLNKDESGTSATYRGRL